MLHFSPDDRRATILNAALEVFTTYGFRKTSMDDIARAAGLSRPALYQNFKNKTEIFRGLAEEMMLEATRKADAEFNQPGCFRDKLTRAIDRSILEMHRFVDQTPHGKELIGISDEIAADVNESWAEAMIDIVSRGLNQTSSEGLVDLTPFRGDATTIARVFVFALEGIKNEVECGNPIEHHVMAVIDFFADAIKVREDQPARTEPVLTGTA